jgi:uncharacterized protein (DUF1810 family)
VSLERFVEAQEPVYDTALAELRRGSKRSHWMWFVFPQLAGLGRSATAQHYALDGLEEAQDYLAHPVLGARLRECAQALLDLGGTDPVAVLGGVDALKLRSSMTLFAQLDPFFARVLDAYYAGEPDPQTLALLGAG